FIFFFSSRRRHTRSDRDWSSDVCSSDLGDEPSSDHDSGDGSSTELVAGISPSCIRDTLAHWADITGIRLDRLVYTSYREVVSDRSEERRVGKECRIRMWADD